MKICIAFLFTIFISGSAFAQLTIKRQKQLAPTNEAVSKFVKDNNFDYALITWTTSNWLRLDHSFDCIFKQGNSWFLARINSVDIPPRNTKMENITVKYERLSKTERNSIISVLKVKQAFSTSQSSFDNISSQSSYIDYSNGIEHSVEIFFDRCKDCNENYLLEYSKSDFNIRNFYAAELLLDSQYAGNTDFYAVKSFLNCYSKLEKIVDDRLE